MKKEVSIMKVGYQLHSQSDTNYAKMKREIVFIIFMSINYIIIGIEKSQEYFFRKSSITFRLLMINP